MKGNVGIVPGMISLSFALILGTAKNPIIAQTIPADEEGAVVVARVVGTLAVDTRLKWDI